MDQRVTEPAADREPSSDEHGPRFRPVTLVITAVILLALLLGPFFVVTSALHIGPFAKRPLRYPAVLLPSSGAYFGAYAPPRKTEDPMGGIRRLESQIGRQLAIDHEYYLWNEPIPTPRQTWDASSGRLPFIDWNARNTDGSAVPWSQIANGSQDAWIIQRANAFKAFGSPIYLAFHHEPEDDLATWGTPADYAAAFRHVVDVFRSQGVSNVAFVWDMMNWTFDPRSGRDPNAYYPGDGYVDIIGVDGYNTYPGKVGTSWESFHQIFQSANDFAFNHNKPWMAVETGTEEDPQQPGRKGQWFRDVIATAKSWPLLKAFIYFDTIKGQEDWSVESSASSAAGFAALGRDPSMSATPARITPTEPVLRNDLDLGPQGAPVQAQTGGGGDPFSRVITTDGSSITYDATHALGRFAARHNVTSGGNAYYQWTGPRSIWYGRLDVWIGRRPPSGLRLIRGSSNRAFRCALDLMPDGSLQWDNHRNHAIVATTEPIALRRWVRIEWKVDHIHGQVTIKLFDAPDSPRATQTVMSAAGAAIGPSVREIQFGRSGTQPFAFTFWTDLPALSSIGYIGPA